MVASLPCPFEYLDEQPLGMNGHMQFPFGGWKESGNGRDKCMDAFVYYTQTKSVWATIDN
jgi:acyl-CoA reductase-like NAD-dependent aldehyde dehydrogenase